MKDNTKVFLKAITNAFLPEFMDSDELKMSTLSQDTQDALQSFLDDQMGDVDEGTYKQFTYEHINKFFQTKSIFEENIEGASKQLKTILGGFGVRRTADGYNVIDTYDFHPRKKTVEGDDGKSKEVNVGYTDVALQLAYNLYTGGGEEGKLYGPARMLGGLLLPENEDRSVIDPKTSNSLSIDWNIGEGQSVRQSKLTNSVLAGLPSKPKSTSTRNREN